MRSDHHVLPWPTGDRSSRHGKPGSRGAGEIQTPSTHLPLIAAL